MIQFWSCPNRLAPSHIKGGNIPLKNHAKTTKKCIKNARRLKMRKKIEKMSHKSEKMRKMSQHKAKSAEARPAPRSTAAHPPLELPPLFCPWGAGINFKHRRAALSVIHRPLGVRCVRALVYLPRKLSTGFRGKSMICPPPLGKPLKPLGLPGAWTRAFDSPLRKGSEAWRGHLNIKVTPIK